MPAPTRKIRFVGGVRVSATQRLWYRNTLAGAWSNAVIADYVTTMNGEADTLYGLCNDYSYDLVYSLQDFLQNVGSACVLNMVASGDDLGKFTLTKPATSVTTVEISARNPAGGTTDNSDNLWQYMFPELAAANIWTKAVTGTAWNSTTYTHPRHHGFCFQPRRLLADDVTKQNYRAAQAVADDGTTRTVFVGADASYRVGLRLAQAVPKGLVFNEYHALMEFMNYANQGAPVIIMPDASVSVPLNRGVDPDYKGYVVGTLLRSSGDLEPKPTAGNYYGNWQFDLEFLAMRVPTNEA